MSGKVYNLSPVIDGYGLLVSLPINTKIKIPESKNIKEAIEAFIKARDDEKSIIKQVDYDRIRAFLSHASYYKATLDAIYLKNSKLKVSVRFPTIENMINFRETMNCAVSTI